jgi:tetratricopeptide (TPR) repeat protein
MVLRRAWRRFPGDFWINFRLAFDSGSGRGVDGPPREAVRFLTAAVAARPNSAIALHCLGIALTAAGKQDDAIACCRQVIKLDPENRTAHLILANALFKHGMVDEAIACCHQVIDFKQSNHWTSSDAKMYSSIAARLLGQILYENKRDYQGAVTALRRAIEIDPEHAHSYYHLGVVLHRQGKLDEAIAALRKVIELDPKLAANAYTELGMILCSGKHDYENGIAAFRQVIVLVPKSARAHHNLGRALHRHGKRDEAIACHHQAIKLDSKFSLAYFDLGVLLCDHKHDYQGGITALRQAIALEPKNAGAHHNLGYALSRLGKLDEAIVSYRKTITLDPRNARAHRDLGLALRQQNNLVEAVAAVRQAVKIDPKYAEAHDQLGWALRLQGKLEEAILSCRKAIELQPREANFHNSLGVALKDQGKLDEAIAEYRRAIELDPKYAQIRGNLAAAERMVAVRDRLPALLAGKSSLRTKDELFALQELCFIQKRYLAGARVYAGAFAADAKLADDVQAGHRYTAACFAALAAAGGQGADKLDDTERLRWRKQALSWLKADLALHQKQAGNGNPARRAFVFERMQHWQKDSDLAGIRDKEALAKLPAEERQVCEKLWADVEALRRQVRPKPAEKGPDAG